MYKNIENSLSIQKEAAKISKYAALNCSRIVLLLCLLILFYPMRPTAIYLFALTAVFPWVFGNILESKHPDTKPLILSFCAEKYHYSPTKHLAEKCIGNAMIFFLIIWQLTVNNASSIHGFWKLSPSICLILYCLCRLISPILFRRKIHNDYLNLRLME